MSSPRLKVAGTGIPLPTTTKRNQRWATDPPRPSQQAAPLFNPSTAKGGKRDRKSDAGERFLLDG